MTDAHARSAPEYHNAMRTSNRPPRNVEEPLHGQPITPAGCAQRDEARSADSTDCAGGSSVAQLAHRCASTTTAHCDPAVCSDALPSGWPRDADRKNCNRFVTLGPSFVIHSDLLMFGHSTRNGVKRC